MPFWPHLGHEQVDIIELAAAPPEYLVYRFPRFQDQIKFGAKLIVREGQVAVFVNEGRLADVFAPGTYSLETRNLPILSTLQAWKYGFSSPFKAEVYFLNTRPVLDLQWGTQQAITLQIPGYGLGQLRAFGIASYRIADAQVFFRQIVGTDTLLVDNDLRDYLRSQIVGQFSQALTESKPTVEQLQSHLSELGTGMLDRINGKLSSLGFQLTDFVVENVSMPPAQQQEIFKYSRLHNVDLSKLTQFEVANSIADIAHGAASGAGGAGALGGLGGQAMQFGVGVAAAQQVMRALDGAFSGMGVAPTSRIATVNGTPISLDGVGASVTPPAQDVVAAPALYHVALDGVAQGPMSPNQVAALVATGKVTPATLVWHPGMQAWAAAGTEAALSHLFPQQPPPLP